MKPTIALSAMLILMRSATVAFAPTSRCRFPCYSKAAIAIFSESSVSTSTETPSGMSNSKASASISSLTVPKLKDLLRQQGLKVSGNKPELVERLTARLMALAQERKKEKLAEMAGMATALKKKREQTEPIRSPTLKKQVEATMENAKAKAKENASNTNIHGSGFREINVPTKLVARLDEMGIMEPTPIQMKAIPLALQGKDVMGVAQTGTGKTLAFGLPLVAQMMEGANNSNTPQKVSRREYLAKRKPIRGLVLAPTRELANQIAVQLGTLTQNTPLDTFVVVGGQNIQTQINKIKAGTDLLVATPGRLIDLMDRGAISLRETSFLVLDEADLMLDMGFLKDLRKIAEMLPKERQTMLFSATMSKDMNEVAKTYLNNPVKVEIARAGKTADKITQEIHFVERTEKTDLLLYMVGHEEQREDRAIVFGRTKHGMERLSKKLIASGIKAASIHGNKSQPQRDKALAAFKSGRIKVLVATDVAARGLDIPDVKRVYNFELPNQPEAYVHRIGRTARAGKEGAAISFCSMEDMEDLMGIQKLIGLDIPVASGTPWTRSEMNREKDRIKANKHIEQRRRNNNRGGGGQRRR